MIGVVIVTYNSEKHIESCLRSVLDELGDGEFCLQVVDNASSDRTIQKVLSQFDGIEVFENGFNKGFSVAVNQGIRSCLDRDCDQILLLNPDTKMEPGSLQEMQRVLACDPKRGAVQPLLTLMKNPERINSWGNEYRGFGLVTVDGYGKEISRVINKINDRPIDFASGACLLIRSEVFDRVGFFDEKYFLYFEDTAFSKRMRDAGYGLFLAGKARVQHDHRFPFSPKKIGHFLAGWRKFRGDLRALTRS